MEKEIHVTTLHKHKLKLFCYNTITNTFEWPFRGHTSSLGPPRFGHSGYLHGNAVFVFGGLESVDTDVKLLKNELLMIDLDAKEIRQIHADTTGAQFN